MTLPAYLPPAIASMNSMPGLGGDANRNAQAERIAGVVPLATGTPPNNRDTAPVRKIIPTDEALSVGVSLYSARKPPSDAAQQSAGDSTEAQTGSPMTLGEFLDMQSRLKDADLVDLPVSVTQILQVTLGGKADDALGTRAKALYEGIQGMLATDPASSVPVDTGRRSLKAA